MCDNKASWFSCSSCFSSGNLVFFFQHSFDVCSFRKHAANIIPSSELMRVNCYRRPLKCLCSFGFTCGKIEDFPPKIVLEYVFPVAGFVFIPISEEQMSPSLLTTIAAQLFVRKTIDVYVNDMRRPAALIAVQISVCVRACDAWSEAKFIH